MQATKDTFFLAYCFVNFIAGCHPFVKVKFQCGNTECNQVQAQDREEFLRIGAWPATPVMDNCVIDISLFKRWRSEKYHASPVSLQTFLKQVEDEAIEHGVKVRSLQLSWAHLICFALMSSGVFKINLR